MSTSSLSCKARSISSICSRMSSESPVALGVVAAARRGRALGWAAVSGCLVSGGEAPWERCSASSIHRRHHMVSRRQRFPWRVSTAAVKLDTYHWRQLVQRVNCFTVRAPSCLGVTGSALCCASRITKPGSPASNPRCGAATATRHMKHCLMKHCLWPRCTGTLGG